MRIPPLAAAWFPPIRRRSFTGSSDLRPIVLRMINSTSLNAFVDAIGRAPAAAPRQAPPPAGFEPVSAPQRQLEAVPPKPAQPPPRGSLLDMRV